MNDYNKYMKIIEKRRTYEQIETAMAVFINLFEETDRIKLINILYRVYFFSELFSGLSIGVLCIGISLYIQSDTLVLAVCGLVFLVINMFRIDKEGLTEKKTQFSILSKNYKSNYTSFYVRTIFHLSKNTLLLKGIIPYLLGMFTAGIIQERTITFFIISIFSAGLIFLFLFLMHIYYSYNLSILKIINKTQLECCFLYKENNIETDKFEKRTGFELLIKRLFYQKYTKIIVKVFSILISILILVVWLVLRANKIDINIMNIVILSIYPVFPSVILTGIVFNGLFQRDFIVSTYYFNKKHNIINRLNLTLFKESLLSITYLVAPMIFTIIINYSNIYCIIGTILCLLHCLVIVFLVSNRISKFTTCAYEKLSSNIVNAMISNGFEDFIIVGFPLIMLSGTIINYLKTGSLSTNIMIYSIFIVFVTIYAYLKTVIQKIHLKKVGSKIAKSY